MANLSIREAVKHFDVSRPTLSKAVKSGKLTGVQDGQGQWSIDPSELARVYQPRPVDKADKADKDSPVNLSTLNTPLSGEVERLRERLAEAEQRAAVAEALAEERARHLDDLRRMLPAPGAVTPPGPSPPPPAAPRPRRWWPWARG